MKVCESRRRGDERGRGDARDKGPAPGGLRRRSGRLERGLGPRPERLGLEQEASVSIHLPNSHWSSFSSFATSIDLSGFAI